MTICLDELLDDDRRPGRSDPDRDRLWRELRGQIDEASVCGPFDVRRVLTLGPAALAAWRDARARWIAELFADDSRVQS